MAELSRPGRRIRQDPSTDRRRQRKAGPGRGLPQFPGHWFCPQRGRFDEANLYRSVVLHCFNFSQNLYQKSSHHSVKLLNNNLLYFVRSALGPDPMNFFT